MLNIIIYQENTKIFFSIEINDLLKSLKIKVEFNNFLNDSHIRIFNTLDNSVSFVL